MTERTHLPDVRIREALAAIDRRLKRIEDSVAWHRRMDREDAEQTAANGLGAPSSHGQEAGAADGRSAPPQTPEPSSPSAGNESTESSLTELVEALWREHNSWSQVAVGRGSETHNRRCEVCNLIERYRGNEEAEPATIGRVSRADSAPPIPESHDGSGSGDREALVPVPAAPSTVERTSKPEPSGSSSDDASDDGMTDSIRHGEGSVSDVLEVTERAHMKPSVSMTPGVQSGDLVVTGSRTPVAALRSFAEDRGLTPAEIREHYPWLTLEQVEWALEADRRIRERWAPDSAPDDEAREHIKNLLRCLDSDCHQQCPNRQGARLFLRAATSQPTEGSD